ncbi:MAG: gamma-glutamyl-gamma-aminobutyrate hydrolase family protein [Actinomycetia bacterium]|jgi:putative glutamine amidotransferase|nr:gamma-glutamyl-gamma-aminobutyrate hydrolase family protein [Actinomycetes bacterium]
MRPVIGISTYVEQARWGVWDTTAALVPYAYVRQVESAGGRAVLLPPSTEDPAEVLHLLDGLLLAGGADVDPARYGAAPHPETAGLRPERDAGELALLGAVLDADLPVLGVCRGMQLMTVRGGGALHQHLPEVVGHERHRPAPGVYGDHGVRLAEGSRVHAVLGERVTVHSYHHQGVAGTGSLTATGWADDGTVEVIEVPGRRFAVGVLWHPEVGDDPRLFEALVGAARQG